MKSLENDGPAASSCRRLLGGMDIYTPRLATKTKVPHSKEEALWVDPTGREDKGAVATWLCGAKTLTIDTARGHHHWHATGSWLNGCHWQLPATVCPPRAYFTLIAYIILLLQSYVAILLVPHELELEN